jgi:5'-deoxynucleotidase YfbR-like HD superfamily hydrolase
MESRIVKEREAKKALRKMLRSFTPGSILHLLADLQREDAEEASRVEDAAAYERCKTVECALVVVRTIMASESVLMECAPGKGVGGEQ